MQKRADVYAKITLLRLFLCIFMHAENRVKSHLKQG